MDVDIDGFIRPRGTDHDPPDQVRSDTRRNGPRREPRDVPRQPERQRWIAEALEDGLCLAAIAVEVKIGWIARRRAKSHPHRRSQ
jgi:hypothetical protein